MTLTECIVTASLLVVGVAVLGYFMVLAKRLEPDVNEPPRHGKHGD